MPEFIILEDKNFNKRLKATGELRAGPFTGIRGARTTNIAPKPKLSVHMLDANDEKDARRNPTIQAIARKMPTRLVAPLASKASIAASTWGITEIGANVSSFTGKGVLPCVLDTGIDTTHSAFSGVNLVEKDFTGTGNGDQNGHGTHCAGTIMGRDVAGNRIGVARGVRKALIGKVLDANGSGTSDMLFSGMQWASNKNAQVLSMSIGFDFPGWVSDMVNVQNFPVEIATSIALEGYRHNIRMFDTLMDMIRNMAALNGGTVVVAAAGNESDHVNDPLFEVNTSIPAAADGILSVGAAKQGVNGLTIAGFSNVNPILSAPGVDVLSADVGGGVRSLSGTSMATPHVAGLAVLWWEKIMNSNIPATAGAVEARLRASTVTSVFDTNVPIHHRGAGLPKAP